jgi:non-heme chloroperoxidase
MMATFTTRDKTSIYYKDWSSGQPVVFAHGWPLTADAWDPQMMFMGTHGYRVIAHDRRGHGRSQQTWYGNDMDSYADDLAELIDTLDLRDVVLVGHSTGGGEVVRYLGRHGTTRVAKLVLVAAVPPLMLRTPSNPSGTPIKVFDDLRAGVLRDRSQFFQDLSIPFYGQNRKGASVSQGVRDWFWLQGMMAGIKPVYDSIAAFSETNFSKDLQTIDVPTLIVHGDDDQIVPIEAAARQSVKLIPGAQLEVYVGAPHGLTQTRADQFNNDLLAFVRS